ncbi:MAG: hypothetical protein CSA38_00075 [Flavobacteriales bacterium]|nr:MAG: hypothetical protein CSA38_00075 [Flavobacteriales bacterium]
MKKFITFLFFTLSPLYCFSQNDTLSLTKTQIEKSTKVLHYWIEEMFKGEDVEGLMSVSDVPFAFDRKKVIKSRAELKALYHKIFKDRGKRKVPYYTTEIFEYKDEIIERCIPISIIKAKVMIIENNRREGALASIVFKNNEYKVVGFSD